MKKYLKIKLNSFIEFIEYINIRNDIFYIENIIFIKVELPKITKYITAFFLK